MHKVHKANAIDRSNAGVYSNSILNVRSLPGRSFGRLSSITPWQRPAMTSSRTMRLTLCSQYKDGSSSAETGWHPLSDPLLWKVCICHLPHGPSGHEIQYVTSTGCKFLSDQHFMVQVLEEDAMFKTPLPDQVSATWKLMLLSDGSVTRHLQLLTGQHIEVVGQSVASLLHAHTPMSLSK